MHISHISRMRHLALAGILFCFASVTTAEPEGGASLLKRDQSVINAFQVMCTLELPKFETIATKAEAMQMRPVTENKLPAPGGVIARLKVWSNGLTTGAVVLTLEEVTGPKGTVTSCAVVADIQDTEALRNEAINTLKLTAIKSPESDRDGRRSFIWEGAYGSETTVVIQDFKPSGKPGIMLKLESRQKP
ncbi:hypothetical protein KIK84_15125 [Curvibacter sp. CHRR-16]|uniref:hypothetical protein n=1 Tax=Curvibacter sp. CHRR-16 TaxID=2835872 RepID=UPI001BD95EAD|nr:hypothetical protein [Curvibacter sp. CHRR-16]MBT0571657.1 hypothetical protein [Curvibacter sp. CHRR-16]